jgi:hypothetical protein
MRTLVTILSSVVLFSGLFLGQATLEKTVTIAGELSPYTLDEDRDLDGISNAMDNCPDKPNGPNGGTCSAGSMAGEPCMTILDCGCMGECILDQEDSDGNGTGDTCEGETSTTTSIPEAEVNDTDNDGVPDFVDNCPLASNLGQANSDSDSYGDACDNCSDYENEDQNDTDGDGRGDVCDNCPNAANPNQIDSDNDVIGDICDICSNDPENDIDGDDVCGNLDNCPDTANSDQADSDYDSIGNECDTCPNDPENDGDNDTVCGDIDSCPESFVAETVVIEVCDSKAENHLFDEGCTMRDLIAECENNASNHGKFVSCVAHLTNDWKGEKLISGKEKGAIQSCAAQADIP